MKYIFFILILFFCKNAFSWQEVDCSDLKVSFKNNNFDTYKCERKNAQVRSEFLLAENMYSSDRQYLYVQHEYFIDPNTIWSNDWAIQALKREKMENEIRLWNLGSIEHIDNSVSKLPESSGVYYKKFKTSNGTGFLITKQQRNHIWVLGFVSENKKFIIDESYIIELYSSIDIKGAKVAKYTSSSKNNFSNTNSNSTNKDNMSFEEFCRESNLGDLSKDIAKLCLEKMN